jgi:glycosyltransferase involved in cell wall biosynthesis
VAIETAGLERKYPWETCAERSDFERLTLFPGRILEDVPATEARRAMTLALDSVRPDVVAVAGYVRPECLAARRWAHRHGRPCVLMSESQAIDRPRTWWKEQVKRARVRSFDAALVGGSRHADYLVQLGMPATRIALGYNAIDHDFFARESDRLRSVEPAAEPDVPYFLTVCRFVPEKGLDTLLSAYARYRQQAEPESAWNLVLCGGGPLEPQLRATAETLEIARFVQWPGFLTAAQLVPWYTRAGAFVLPSRSEPWGLVANEAAACACPLILSEAAGCTPSLLPAGSQCGRSFTPNDVASLAQSLHQIATVPADQRRSMGLSARTVASAWGPARFGQGLLEAVEMAHDAAQQPRLRPALKLATR